MQQSQSHLHRLTGVIALACALGAVQASPIKSQELAVTAESKSALAEQTKPVPVKSLDEIRAAMAAAEQHRQAALAPDPAIDNKAMAEQWGVEVTGISRTAGGYMLDFRFRVVDAQKAQPLFDHRIKPFVTPAKSDIKLPVPVGSKTGAMRPTNRGKNIKADKGYYMVFANPDSYVKAGDKVSVIIGDFKAENLTVDRNASGSKAGVSPG